MKYVVVTGGVLSGLGKGITASSIGVLLKSAGLSVTSVKIDPYLNCDAGTMSPFEHGEVYVLDDGGEVDLDLGNYERFLDISLTSLESILFIFFLLIDCFQTFLLSSTGTMISDERRRIEMDRKYATMYRNQDCLL